MRSPDAVQRGLSRRNLRVGVGGVLGGVPGRRGIAGIFEALKGDALQPLALFSILGDRHIDTMTYFDLQSINKSWSFIGRA